MPNVAQCISSGLGLVKTRTQVDESTSHPGCSGLRALASTTPVRALSCSPLALWRVQALQHLMHLISAFFGFTEQGIYCK